MTRTATLALLAGSAAGARIAKKGGEKFIAGVPVLNYEDAYNGESLGEFGAEQAWNVVLKKGAKDSQIKEMCARATNGCDMVGHPEQGGMAFFEMRGTEEDLEVVIKACGDLVEFVEPDTLAYAIPELKADNVENGLYWQLASLYESISCIDRSTTSPSLASIRSSRCQGPIVTPLHHHHLRNGHAERKVPPRL